MLSNLRKLVSRNAKPAHKGTPLVAEPRPTMARPAAATSNKGPSFSKVIRYRLPDGQTVEPKTVEVVGSFNNWQPQPLQRDGKLDSWHATVHHIPGNKTHHYMLLIDGKPTMDKNCDGLAVPHGPQEEHYAVETDRGPRVMMMFAMTK
jgi:hypothetical protein